ncbi:hypothetical protein GmHk_02G005159 [Glycine max]|nr:hypothetical protein GmHk_02G005159 [Glycine max]
MSYIDLTKVIKSISYNAFKCLWYRHPKKTLWRGLKPLNGDSNILQLAEDVVGFDVVEVYVEDGVIDRCDKKLDDVEGDEVVVIDGVVEGEVQVEAEAEVQVEAEVQAEAKVEVEGEVQVEAEVEVEGQVQLDDEGLVEVEVQVQEEAGGMGDMEVVVECLDDIHVGVDTVDDDLGSDESDEDYIGDEEDDDDDDSNDCSEDSSETFSQSTEATFDPNKLNSRNSDLAYETENSNELDTPVGSEDEGPPKVRYPHFKVTENDEDVKFEVGLQFSGKKQILEAVKTFAIMSKKNLKIKKNDKRKVTVICKQKDCPFYLRVSKSMQATYWQVVSFQNEHCCFRTFRNSQATPEWVSKRLMSLLMHSPNMRLKALVAFALEKLSMDQAYKAKVKVMEKIEGATRDQYKHLRSYAA